MYIFMNLIPVRYNKHAHVLTSPHKTWHIISIYQRDKTSQYMQQNDVLIFQVIVNKLNIQFGLRRLRTSE